MMTLQNRETVKEMANGQMLQILPVSQLTCTLSSGPRLVNTNDVTYCNSESTMERKKENPVKPSEWKHIRYSDDDSVIVTFGFPL